MNQQALTALGTTCTADDIVKWQADHMKATQAKQLAASRTRSGMDANTPDVPSSPGLSVAAIRKELDKCQGDHARLRLAMCQTRPVVLLSNPNRPPLPNGVLPIETVYIHPQAPGYVCTPFALAAVQFRERSPSTVYSEVQSQVQRTARSRTGSLRSHKLQPISTSGSQYSSRIIQSDVTSNSNSSDDSSDDESKPAAPAMKPTVVSGGLPGMKVAEDLMYIDFQKPKEVAEVLETKAIPWNIEPSSIEGEYGPYEPDSPVLSSALARVEAQQAELIDLLRAAEARQDSGSEVSSVEGRKMSNARLSVIMANARSLLSQQDLSKQDQEARSEHSAAGSRRSRAGSSATHRADGSERPKAAVLPGSYFKKGKAEDASDDAEQEFKLTRDEQLSKNRHDGVSDSEPPKLSDCPTLEDREHGREGMDKQVRFMATTAAPQGSRSESAMLGSSLSERRRLPSIHTGVNKTPESSAASVLEGPAWQDPIIEEQAKIAALTAGQAPFTGPLPSGLSFMGCLLALCWAAAFVAYIAVRAALTIDRKSSIFAYQVTILIIEAIVGVTTGQHALALISRLESVDAIQTRHDDDVAALVTSGKAKSTTMRPTPARQQPASIVTLSQPSAISVAPPSGQSSNPQLELREQRKRRVTYGSSTVASIVAKLSSGFWRSERSSGASLDGPDRRRPTRASNRDALSVMSISSYRDESENRAEGNAQSLTQQNLAELPNIGGTGPSAMPPQTVRRTTRRTTSDLTIRAAPETVFEGAASSRTAAYDPPVALPVSQAVSQPASQSFSQTETGGKDNSGPDIASQGNVGAAHKLLTKTNSDYAAADFPSLETAAFAYGPPQEQYAEASKGGDQTVAGANTTGQAHSVLQTQLSQFETIVEGQPLDDEAGKPLAVVARVPMPFWRDQSYAHLGAVGGTASVTVKPAAAAQKPQQNHHIQVLIWAAPEHHLDAIEKTLSHLNLAVLPPGCTQAIYVIDNFRRNDWAQSIAEQGYPNVTYVATVAAGQQVADLGRAASFNRALKRLYPNPAAPPADSDLVAIFEADHWCHPNFFLVVLEALARPGVVLASTPPSFRNQPDGADVFDLLERQYTVQARGCEGLGMVTTPLSSPFVVQVKALSEVGWLPLYSEAIGAALGRELRVHNRLSLLIETELSQRSLATLPHVMATARHHAAGHFHMLFRHTYGSRGKKKNRNYEKPRGRHRLLYRIWPLMLLIRALALPVWVLVPLLQIVLGVFPWTVNRAFGIVAVIYYGMATPLLFQGYKAVNRRGMWHGCTAIHALAPSIVAAAASAIRHGRRKPLTIADFKTAASLKSKAVSQPGADGSDPMGAPDAIESQPVDVRVPVAPSPVELSAVQQSKGAAEQREIPMWRKLFGMRASNRDITAAYRMQGGFGESDDESEASDGAPPLVTEQPNGVANPVAIPSSQPTYSALDASNGTTATSGEEQQGWSTIHDTETLSPTPRCGPLRYVPWFATGLWLICLAGTGLGLWLLFTSSRAGYTVDLDGFGASLPLIISTTWLMAHVCASSPAVFFAMGVRRDQLALTAGTAEALCWLLGLTAAVAAIGLGSAGRSSGVQREGFVQAKGATVPGLPASR